ncbi:MAG: hypothetical protein ACO3RD_05720 [Candidatus Nanopelagicaceae bacterium]|jgi:hypothetical protein
MQKEAKSFKRIWLAQLALVYNLMILFSVVLNLSWVETRAAGGQYTDFPISIRILYFFMSIGTAILIFYLRKLTSERVTSQDIKFARYLGWLFIVSTILQLISRSPNEQWNAIPAAVIATTFLLISRRG